MKILRVKQEDLAPAPIESITITLPANEARMVLAAMGATSKHDLESGYRFMGFNADEADEFSPVFTRLFRDLREALTA